MSYVQLNLWKCIRSKGIFGVNASQPGDEVYQSFAHFRSTCQCITPGNASRCALTDIMHLNRFDCIPITTGVWVQGVAYKLVWYGHGCMKTRSQFRDPDSFFFFFKTHYVHSAPYAVTWYTSGIRIVLASTKSIRRLLAASANFSGKSLD